MAHEQFHLYTIVRPGPYICAEWSGGGFPRWLLDKRRGASTWLRGDDPDYLKWCAHWYQAVCKVVAPEQITRKPAGEAGVILFQIENEYDYDSAVAKPAKIGQLHELYADAIKGGIDVPIFTCWTREIRGTSDPMFCQVFDAINQYPWHKLAAATDAIGWAQHDQPDAPVMVSELQGGWFSRVGGKLSQNMANIEPEQTRALTLTCLRDGATILNYYMLVGGTNFGGWGGRDITTTYDYDAPIGECGGVGEKYRVVKAIGEMLESFGPQLARSRIVKSQHESNGATIVVRQSNNGTLLIFLSRPLESSGQSGTAALKLADDRTLTLNYDLSRTTFLLARVESGKSDATVDQWLPRVIAPADPPPAPAPVSIAQAIMRDDAGSLDWKPLELGKTLLAHDVEEPRFVLYRATPTLSDDQAGSLRTLHLDLFASDLACVSVNGHGVIAKAGKKHALDADVATLLVAGQNEIIVLYDDQGQANGGNEIQTPPGLKAGRLASAPSDSNPLPLTWSIADHLAGANAQSWQPSLDTSSWKRVSLTTADSDQPSAPIATWYRADFQLPANDPHLWVPWKAKFDLSGNAYLYLNGHALGRYWDAGPQTEFYLPECWLNFGPAATNNLTIVVRPTAKGSQLHGIDVSPYKEFAESR
jgi:Glycosyl hydrolases family 35/Beta-galactosidase jelly roll domain